MSSWKEIKRSLVNVASSKEETLGPECIMEDRCFTLHTPPDCRTFLLLPVQHRRTLAVRKGYCLLCLTHENQTPCGKGQNSRLGELWRQEHWLMTRQHKPGTPITAQTRLPRIKHVPGRLIYQYCLSLTLEARKGQRKGNRLTIKALFNNEAESTVILNETALDLGLPSIRVTPFKSHYQACRMKHSTGYVLLMFMGRRIHKGFCS
jgi:hypothetical protein